MKKIFLLLILAIILNPAVSFAQTPSVSPEEEIETESLDNKNNKVDQIKDKVASRVAQLKLVEKRGMVGIVEEVNENEIRLNDLNDKTRIIEVDELTKYSSENGSFDLTDIEKGTKISAIGLYNKDSEKLLARFINEISIPVFINGVISEKDDKEFTITLATIDEKKYTVDVERITRSFSFNEGELETAGFAKLETLKNALIIGYIDPKDENRISATRIIVFPDLPKNPGIEVKIPEPSKESSSPYSKRKMIKDLKAKLVNFDAILISSIPNIIYLTNFSGFSEIEREAFFLITKTKNYLITDQRYSEAIKKTANDFEVIDTGAIHFLVNSEDFFMKKNINALGIEENNLTVSEYKLLKKYLTIKNVDLGDLRIIKKTSEIENIKKACKIGDLAFDFILSKLKIGVTEKDISNELINFFQSKSADSSFKPIVAFAAHSSVPHHENTNQKLERNQIVLLDFGVKVNNYCSDMTRTIFFGKANSEFKRIYSIVLEAQTTAIQFLKSALTNQKSIYGHDIDKVARSYISKQNYPSIPHSVGHGIGIEVHEFPSISPSSKYKIKNGMVFSVGPGIYIPGFGGVRIEDLVLVRDGTAELISLSKREIIEVNV